MALKLLCISLSFFMFIDVSSGLEIAKKPKFKLSDLPVLKRYEIPQHQFQRHVGRKYKDLEREKKRSTYWELKPDFTANELDWDEDPEKIKLDFNYKSFFDEDGESKEAAIEDRNFVKAIHTVDELPKNKDVLADKKSEVIPLASNLKSKNELEGKIINKGKNKNLSKRSKKIKTKKNNRTVKKNHNVKRHKRSLDEPEEMEVRKQNEEDLDLKEGFEDESRSKRDTLSDIVSKARVAQAKLEKQLNDKNNIPTQTQKRGTIIKHHENFMKGIKGFITDKQLKILEETDSKTPVKKILKNIRKEKGVLGDEQSKLGVVKSIVKSVKETQEVFPKSKATQPTVGVMTKLQKSLEKTKDIKATTREKIDHPNVNMDIVPSNVARAVAMAMEQLKRDKMWGKVFVHVRPSGQLKVMVQETKRMDDDS